MKLFFLLITLSFIGCNKGKAQNVSTRCDDIKSAVLPGVMTEVEAIKRIGASNFKVMLLGDNHSDSVAQAHNLELLKAIQKQSTKKIDCVLMELPRDLQPRIDLLLTKKLDFDDFIRSLRPTIDGISEESIVALQDNIKQLFQPAFRFAIEENAQLIAIDDYQRTIESEKTTDYFVGKRTTLFKNEILSLIEGNVCKRAVFIVGSAHIGAISENREYKSLNQWFNESNLALISVLSPSVNSEILNPLPEISECGIDLGQQSGVNFATQVNRKSKNTSLFSDERAMEGQGYKGWSSPLYNDFDYLLFNR